MNNNNKIFRKGFWIPKNKWKILFYIFLAGVFIYSWIDMDLAVNNNKSKSDRALYKGEEIVDKGIYKEAISNFDEAIKYNPGNYMAYYKKGLLYDKSGLSDSALKNYNKVIEVYDNGKNKEVIWTYIVANAYNAKGLYYQKQKDFAKSISEFTRAIEIWNSSNGYYYRGMSYLYGLNDTVKAIDDFTKANENATYKHNYLALLERGKVYTYLKKYDMAIKDLNSALSVSPNQGDAYAARCITYTYLKKYKEANDDYQKAINFKPELRFYLIEILNKNLLFPHS